MIVYMNRIWLNIYYFVWFYDNLCICDISYKYLVWKVYYIIVFVMEKLWLIIIIGDFFVLYGFIIKIECFFCFMKIM